MLLSGRLEGIGWFTYQNLRRIVRDHPEVKFYFLFDRPFGEEFVFGSNVEPVVLFPPARHPFLYYLYFEWSVARVLKRLNPDLFLSPDGFLSSRYHGNQLPVFHDLNFMHNPGFVPRLTGKFYNYYFPKYAAIARRIVTVSEFSRQDIARVFDYPENRIDVVYNGAHEIFAPADQLMIKNARKLLTGGAPYFVYIGALHKRKNIGNMLRAFEHFRGHDPAGHKLLIVGAPMFNSPDLEKAYRGLKYKEDVIFAGRQYNESLSQIVSAASALILVSHFEGFGIPVIEAMQCDVPVIASNVTSLPEVAGDAALLVDPDSVDQIALAMTRISSEPLLREHLIEKGRIQRQKFSWDKTAALLWDSVEKCL